MTSLPVGLEQQRRLGPEWGDWLDRLPRLRAELLEEWELVPDGEPMHGFCSLVVPVRTAAGEQKVLKVALPDDESEHEALALQAWQGGPAVRLLRADPRRRVMLLERLQPRSLEAEWDVEACEVVGDLYRRLHVAAPPQLRPLASYVARWSAALGELPRHAPVPRRLVEQAVALTRDLLAGEQPDRLLHTDLHYANVLAADRAPWLVIDPKPVSGDPHYEPAPLLWNRWDELAGDVRAGVRRRFHAVVDAALLDEDRARDWVVVRMAHNALWTVQDALRAGRALDPGERQWITRCVTIAKAVED